MIKSVQLEKFKCFSHTKFTLKDLSILVGKNNAGKTTIIEALRLIALVANKYRSQNYVDAPSQLALDARIKGILPSYKVLPIELGINTVYYYLDPPAKITVVFSNRAKFEIYIYEKMIFAVIYDKFGNLVRSKAQASQIEIPQVKILQQIRPIQKSESQLNEDTVVDAIDTYLTSRHFRNELFLLERHCFNTFKRMAEASWPDLVVEEIEKVDSVQLENGQTKNMLYLWLKDDRFTIEAGNVGNGLQMWLQVIWFLCRTDRDTCIILDEPDVYMHPDLQRRLIDIVKNRYKQVVIATHSVEIMAAVEPSKILFVDKSQDTLPYATDVSAVQIIVENIGGVYNFQLIRLGQAKKCIFVEGEDMIYLRLFNEKFFPDAPSIELIPNIDIGGFREYKIAIGGSKTFENISNETILSYCILDRDYNIESTLANIKKEAEDKGLNLHIWKMKEIENYFIIPKVIFRVVRAHVETACEQTFMEKFNSLLDEYQDFLVGKFLDTYKENDRSLQPSTALGYARQYVQQHWTSIFGKISLIPGKEFFGRVKVWIKSDYSFQLSERDIVNEMRPEELNAEIRDVLSSINESMSFEEYMRKDA